MSLGDIILDKFFIQLSDFLIRILLWASNMLLSIFREKNEKFDEDDASGKFDLDEGFDGFDGFDGLNLGDSQGYFDLDDESNLFASNLKLPKIFNDGDIYEQLESKYLNNQRMFTHQNGNMGGNEYGNENGDGDGYGDGNAWANGKNNLFSNLKGRIIVFLLDNKFFKIKSSEDIFKLIFIVLILIVIISLLIGLFLSFELSIAFLMSFMLIAFLIIYLPKMNNENKYSSISNELPYALRQLSTELKAGKSLYDAIGSVVDSDYGVLSMEFSRVLEEIKYGESSEDAFLNLEKRVSSKALSRVIYEILASLRIGSNLSNSLSIIAEDVNFDMRMKLKEYSEKLNAFIMIYTFLAILAPVIVLTMLLAASVVIGDLIPGDLVLIIFGLFFPMVILFLAFMIKKLEPKI